MALHRDIYWVGKQWAVTGHGIQACNQKQRSQFDVAASCLWDDGVQDALRAEKWVNAEDFQKAVEVARKYYPEPPRKTPPPVALAPPPEVKPVPPVSPIPVSEEPKPKPAPPLPVQDPPRQQVPPKFDLCVEGGAKLTPVWRIRSPLSVSPHNPPPDLPRS